jgi:hypothetical protein
VSDEQPEMTAPETAEQPETTGQAPAPTATHVLLDPEDAPPAGEDIHLPPGSAIPLVMAVGITLTLVGTTINWLWTIIGGIIFIVSLALWIRDTRREVAHLPDELGSPSHH